jgi:hypothetical protein
VTDGPDLEAKEYMAGFSLLDVASRERAVELAARIPDIRHIGVQLRRVVASGLDDQ